MSEMIPDPVPPVVTEDSGKGQNQTTIVLLLIGALVLACLCFVLGVVFGIWAWETGDQWFSLLPALAQMA